MRSDNSFRKARVIGSLGSSVTAPLRASDRLSNDDRRDVYRFNLLPGNAFQARSSFRSRGGSLDVQFFFRNPETRGIESLTTRQTLRPGRASNVITLPTNQLSTPLQIFIRFDRPTRNVRYRFGFQSLS
ncbi:MAG: hypothetical protein MUF49_09415 [Oculatellaceae cyanobacterium Prado106]|nr:hypothetical protein [Oculatellaceae cyanobacterium Prado106]